MAEKAFPGVRPAPAGDTLHRLAKRPDFVKARHGTKAHKAPFVLQARARGDNPPARPARIGITVTKKVGGAVVRNRIKRRLRAVIALSRGLGFKPGYDYVLIARPIAQSAPFDALTGALKGALTKVHSSSPSHRRQPTDA